MRFHHRQGGRSQERGSKGKRCERTYSEFLLMFYQVHLIGWLWMSNYDILVTDLTC